MLEPCQFDIIKSNKKMFTLFNVISADGFIARTDGSEDFIPDDLWINFLNLCEKYGVFVMGRKTYESIQTYTDNLLVPFEKAAFKKIVLTQNANFKTKEGYEVFCDLHQAVSLYPDALVASGPTLNNFLLANHLVKKIILHKVPESIGDGIKPFDEKLVTLTALENVAQLDGVTVLEYEVA